MKKTKTKPKTRREAVATEVVAKTAKPPREAGTRKRQGNVRGLILGLLESGPMPTSELVAKGKFSTAAAFMHLKALRAEGAISAARQGREVFYTLAGGAALPAADSASPVAAAPRKRGRKPGFKVVKVAKAGAGSSLSQELESLSRRLAPIEALDEKLSVLDQLIGSLPKSVSKVLGAIRGDLSRLGA